MKLLIPFLLTIVVITGCQDSASNVVPKIGEEFNLKIGETVAFSSAGITVSFEELSEDSRCPADAQCVWAGNAQVVLKINGNKRNLNTNAEPKSVEENDIVVKFLSLTPYPELRNPIRKEDYTATLIASQK